MEEIYSAQSNLSKFTDNKINYAAIDKVKLLVHKKRASITVVKH